MPMFEYKCSNCDYRFEKFVQRWDAKMTCPLCDQPVEKLLSRFSVGSSGSRPGALPANMQAPMCTKC